MKTEVSVSTRTVGQFAAVPVALGSDVLKVVVILPSFVALSGSNGHAMVEVRSKVLPQGRLAGIDISGRSGDLPAHPGELPVVDSPHLQVRLLLKDEWALSPNAAQIHELEGMCVLGDPPYCCFLQAAPSLRRPRRAEHSDPAGDEHETRRSTRSLSRDSDTLDPAASWDSS